MYGVNSERTSHVGARELPAVDAAVSRFSETGSQPGSGGSLEGPPVVDESVAYVAGDVRIEARDIATGERVWAVDPGDSVGTSPVLACGTIFVSTVNETLALTTDGEIVWRTEVGSQSGVSASPVAVDQTLYVVGSGITALNAETGEKRWHEAIEHSAQGVAVADRVYVSAASNGTGEVAAVTQNGAGWWRTTRPGEVYAAPVVAENRVFAVSKAGTLTALATADGRVEWQAGVEQGVTVPPAVAAGIVVVSAGNGTAVRAFDVGTGEPVWSFETGVSQSAPVVVGERVLASGANTGIHVLDLATGKRLRHYPADYVGSQPVAVDGKLFYRAWNVSDTVVIG